MTGTLYQPPTWADLALERMFPDLEDAVSKRSIIQIASTGVANNATTQCDVMVHALCSDGTIWQYDNAYANWIQLPEIPDGPPASIAP